VKYNNDIDFKQLNSNLLAQSESLLATWLPGGRLFGKEWTCGSLQGESGGSCKVNISTGRWSDFATNQAGGDLVSLYAEINGIGNVEAAKQLGDNYSIPAPKTPAHKTPALKKSATSKKPATAIEVAFANTRLDNEPDFNHYNYGKPSEIYPYQPETGAVSGFVCRYDYFDEKNRHKKTFTPFSFTKNGWIKKQRPDNRPLFGLELLPTRNAVLICEGEKSAVAAREICGDIYACMSWPGGTNGVSKSDWSPLFDDNLHVLVWPDADEAGFKAAAEVVKTLVGKTKTLKVIKTDHNSGWDAADALNEGMDWPAFKDWALPLTTVAEVPQVLLPEPALTPDIIEGPPLDIYEAEFQSQDYSQNIPDEIKGAIANPVDVALWMSLGVMLTAKHAPIINIASCFSVFDNCDKFSGKIWFDEFHNDYFTNWDCKEPRPWTDVDDLKVAAYFNNKLKLTKIKDSDIYKAVLLYGKENVRNEPRDWISSIKWDGVPRVEGFFSSHYGCEPNDYVRRVSINFWVSMVARVFKPGCKVDNMVVFEGKQGAFKSTALSAIGGKWYVETNQDPSNKDFFLMFNGKFLVEIGELDSFNKKETTKIKSVISTATDKYRPPYARRSEDFPRQCIFSGTTNEEEYLKDPTGARRFWPLRIARIDIKAILRDRPQLFAEALSLFNGGEKWYIEPPGAEKAQDKRREDDPWEAPLAEFLDTNNHKKMTLVDITKGALEISVDKNDLRVSRRVGVILRRLGWKKKRFFRGENKVTLWAYLEQKRD